MAVRLRLGNISNKVFQLVGMGHTRLFSRLNAIRLCDVSGMDRAPQYPAAIEKTPLTGR
jgi:hypothetical protein